MTFKKIQMFDFFSFSVEMILIDKYQEYKVVTTPEGGKRRGRGSPSPSEDPATRPTLGAALSGEQAPRQEGSLGAGPRRARVEEPPWLLGCYPPPGLGSAG